MKKKICCTLVLIFAMFCWGCSMPETDAVVSDQVETLQEIEGIEEETLTEEVMTVVAESTESVELETEVEEPKDNSVNLLMVGDMLMHMRINKTGIKEDGTIDFSHLFTHTTEMISAADIAIVNQEIILGGPELGISGYPTFNTYYEVGDALVEAGFDVVLHATNHAVDKGKKGVLNCLSYWDNTHPEIGVVGIYDSQEERDEIYVVEKNGIRIAILNYTYGTNGLPLPSDMPFAVNLMDKELMKRDIEAAKEVSDFVVVCPHWGTEYVLEESSYQREYSQFFLECGVDLVIGTHPHVIEPVEMWEDESGHQMLVYYSLGNYVNSTASTASDIGRRMLGAMAEVTISKAEDGDAYISEYGAQPIVTYVSANRQVIEVYPLEEFTDEMAQGCYTITQDAGFGRTYCEEIWERVMGDLR